MSSNDVKVEKQEVSINFRQRPYIPTKYVFEMDDRPDFEQTSAGVVRIRKYPAFAPGTWTGIGFPMEFDQQIETYVTEGYLYGTTEVREKEVYGTLIISGDTEAALPYPMVHSLNYYQDGTARDIRGNEISINVSFDSVKNAIVTNRPCYAVVRYSFVTQYQILRYYPNIVQDVEMYYMPDPNDYGQLLGYIKTPHNLDPLQPVIFQITPPESIAAEFEVYRVESVAIAKEDGLWEKPTAWPTNGQYEGRTESLDPNESNVQITRTHEIGYFSLHNSTARASSRQSMTTQALPMDFSKELRFADTPNSNIKVGYTNTSTYSDGSKLSQSYYQSVKTQQANYYDKYKKLLHNPPRMRTVFYDVPIAEPYKSTSQINTCTEVQKVVSTATVVDPQGSSSKRTTISESIKQYRIKLTVKASNRPTIGTEVFRNKDNASDMSYQAQVARINSMLGLIWEGIDWNHIRKRIAAAYDPEIYQVTFDGNFPTSN